MIELRNWFEEQIGAEPNAQPSDTGFPLRSTLAEEAVPRSVSEAREFFHNALFDYGSGWVFRQIIRGREVFYVFAGTDGDDGWLEVFDLEGGFLMAAFVEGNHVTWEDRAAARARIYPREA